VVEFLFWEECPSHEEALALLREVLAEAGLAPDDVRIVEVHTDEDAVRLAFPGSPTIRVSGRDIDPEGAGRPSLSCRIYHLPDGRPSPVPSRQQLEEALRP
jgi:8-oxo-dGTP pyrophosphatase MutT (NUDIX family)